MRMHRLTLPLVFPSGASPGEAATSNVLAMARDGSGRALLRGTALAGGLRQAFRDRIAVGDPGQVERQVEVVFGTAGGDPERQLEPSRLEVPDCPITIDECVSAEHAIVSERTHNQINRHTGTVLDGSLFTIEALPPGVKTQVVLWLRDDGNLGERGEDVLADIVAIVRGGLILGGRSNRGVGMARLDGEATGRSYDLGSIEDHAAYLDDHRLWRQNEFAAMSPGHPVVSGKLSERLLSVEMVLKIPRGQDLLVSSGRGDEYGLEPQKVRAADGNDYWLLPGSTLRGVMRAWVSRLAAREGKPVAFDLTRHRDMGAQVTGEDLGWCFLPQEHRRPGGSGVINCSVARLFGSLVRRGRIHISDSLCLCREGDAQHRRHVAIDRVTGGANEGGLFDNLLLVSRAQPNSLAFNVSMLVKDPNEDEARWLAQAIQAIDIGLVRVGSSKAAGRLALQQKPSAIGPYADLFNSLQPFESDSPGGQ